MNNIRLQHKFLLFLSKVIRLTLVRNQCFNVMLFKNINYMIICISRPIYIHMRAANVYIFHWPAIRFLMS
jgi:hypothetical protein